MTTSGLLEIPTLGDQGAEASSGETPDEVSDERSLLLRLRRKDPAAIEALVRTHQDRVYDFCFRMLGDREEASDLAQEIFLSVVQNVKAFRQDSKLATWILRISKNHCLNRLKYLKRRGRGRSSDVEEVGEAQWAQVSSGPVKPDDALISARERARVQRAISQLPEDQRMLVALRDIDGMSYEEIMEVTELPEGTVKSRLHRARERLAELLGGLEP